MIYEKRKKEEKRQVLIWRKRTAEAWMINQERTENSSCRYNKGSNSARGIITSYLFWECKLIVIEQTRGKFLSCNNPRAGFLI